jgi:uroporphyrinogen-III decarboxylase
MTRPVTIKDIHTLDELEANVERVFAAVRGLREDETAFVLGIAQYGALWMAADARITERNATKREKLRDDLVAALLKYSMESGKEYAKIMIDEGSIRGRVRPV